MGPAEVLLTFVQIGKSPFRVWGNQYVLTSTGLGTCIIINDKKYLNLPPPCENFHWKFVSVCLQLYCRNLSLYAEEGRMGDGGKLRCLKFCRNSENTSCLLISFPSLPSYLLDRVSSSCYCHLFTSFEPKQIQQIGDEKQNFSSPVLETVSDVTMDTKNLL